jgi:hypothetical protein
MRIVFIALILLLSISTVYFYLQARHLEQVHELALANLQEKLNLSESECQTKIARVRNHYETQLARRESHASQPGPGMILDVFNNIKEKAKQNQAAVVQQTKEHLDLDTQTFVKFSKVLDRYAANKRKVLELSHSENKPFFDQRYLDMLAQYQEQAMADLEQIFSPEQMQSFRDLGFDKELGLTAR